MANYRFVTTTEIAVPIERAWPEITQPTRWATWWPGLVRVRELEPGDDEGIGALEELTFKSRLPYTLVFQARITALEPFRSMEVQALGELEGVAEYEFQDLGSASRMILTWTVRTNKLWMNLLAPVARPFFSWNHDVLMKAGARGLARKLDSELTYFEAGRPPRRWWMLIPIMLLAERLWRRMSRR